MIIGTTYEHTYIYIYNNSRDKVMSFNQILLTQVKTPNFLALLYLSSV